MTRAVAVVVLLGAILNGLVAALPGPDLMDFGSFVESGRAAGQGLDPYGIYPLTFHVALPGFEAWNPNLNPPPSLPLFQLLARMEPASGFRWWWGVSFLCYAATVWLLARRYGGGAVPVAWAFALAGFWDTLVLGQIYLPLVLAAMGAWLLLERERPLLAGLLIGVLVAVKPNFAVWPVLLLLAGHVRPVLAATVSAALLALVPLALYGAGVYGQWIDLVARDSDRAAFLTNASLSGMAQRAGVDGLGPVLGLAVLAALAVRAGRARLSPLDASALGLVGAILASPIAWVHYTLFLLPVFLSRKLSPPLLLSAALLVVPVPLVLRWLDAPWWAQVSVGSVYAWAAMLCLVGLMYPPRGKARSPRGDTATEVEVAREEGAR